MSKREFYSQALSALWASVAALVISASFIVAVAYSTHGRPTSIYWVSQAPTSIALGATILRGAIASLLGVALYQHLWSRLSTSGLTVRHLESYHRASRLSVSMFLQASISIAWTVGGLGLVFLSAIPPVLQSAVGPVAATRIVAKELNLLHAQLSPRMAFHESLGDVAAGATSMVHRNAVFAMYGEEFGHQYVAENVTGVATTGNIKFADVECDIVAAEHMTLDLKVSLQ